MREAGALLRSFKDTNFLSFICLLRAALDDEGFMCSINEAGMKIPFSNRGHVYVQCTYDVSEIEVSREVQRRSVCICECFGKVSFMCTLH